MGDRPLAAGEVVVLHHLSTNPDATIPPWYPSWRLEREGLLVSTGRGGKAVTDKGAEALAKALTSPPRLNPETVVALGRIDRAGRRGLVDCWPAGPIGLAVVRLFGLIQSQPPDAAVYQPATWHLTEAGKQELQRLHAARRAAAPMSQTQAQVVRAVAIGYPKPVAPDRSYDSCHRHGWLNWTAGSGRNALPRRQVTPAGWRALIGYHRRENTPLHLPVRALAPGHVVRLRHQAAGTTGPVCVARIAAVRTSGKLVGYLVFVAGQPGHRPRPWPGNRPLPPATPVEVVDYLE